MEPVLPVWAPGHMNRTGKRETLLETLALHPSSHLPIILTEKLLSTRHATVRSGEINGEQNSSNFNSDDDDVPLTSEIDSLFWETVTN